MYPDESKENGRGEMKNLERIIYGSDVSNLLLDMFTNRKTYLSPAIHASSFLKVLADTKTQQVKCGR